MNPAMGGTQNLSGTITQLNLTSINGQIAPQPIKFALMFDFATTIAFRASASVFIRFNPSSTKLWSKSAKIAVSRL